MLRASLVVSTALSVFTMQASGASQGVLDIGPAAYSGLAQAAPAAPAAPEAPAAPAADAPPAAPPEPTSFWQGWKGSIEGGLNGSEGNSENLNIRGGISGARKTKPMETTASLTYNYATSDGEKTKSRGEFNLRNDWNFGESPWGFYALGRIEYDEFQDWDWRFSVYAGPTYALIRTEKTTLKLRAGLGFSKEIGGSRNEIIPELNLGADFSHQLTERQRIFASFDYYPSLLDFSEFRTVGKAGWEILVDPEVNMTLKLGIEHRHQSDPGVGKKKNDIDYFALIAWTF